MEGPIIWPITNCMSVVEFVRVIKCTTAVFENVLGMWRRKHLHYLKTGIKYTTPRPLRAYEYGDPPKRPCFFLFISHE
eukprot:scaffold1262_cov206-Chaetoceros_neogracile.AAC.15